ncbi:hypothetical protein [Streptomyces tubercidicus]|uniref:hypothetical protein n=1 Tax=Streptomyces tubercidicus TaxID=47759 RepID=UPI00346627C8
MSETTVALILGLVGLVGGLLTALFGLWSSRATARASIQQAKEAAGGPTFNAELERKAKFQMYRREQYAALLEALTDDGRTGEIPKRTRAAQLVAREGSLRGTLDALAADPKAFQNTKQLSDLARAMNEDAGK